MLFDPAVLFPLCAAWLMAVSCSLLGALLFVTRKLLIGETLSHAAFPGAVFSAAFVGLFGFAVDRAVLALGFAAFSALLGYLLVHWLTEKKGISHDAALCFVLSSFFGLGVLIASQMQKHHPEAYRQSLVFLFGQVVTMSEGHVLLYLILVALVVTTVALFFPWLKTASFDPLFAKLQGLFPGWLSALVSFLTIVAIVISLRGVGVVLLSAVLIAPAAAARQWSSSFSSMMILSVVFGTLSSLGGTFLSLFWGAGLLPTGPSIALVACFLALMSLLLAPRRGFFSRLIQTVKFSWKCRSENIVKALYKHPAPVENDRLSLLFLRLQNIVRRDEKGLFVLTEKGEEKALQVIRLHRLFELYLTKRVGLDKERVHRMAEEAEHAITPEMEMELDHELNYPEHDPHEQPIPSKKRRP